MLTSSSKHAIRALLYLGENCQSEYCSVSELSKRSGVPSAYLSKIMHSLALKSLIVSKKGVGGGVALAAKNTSFYQICEALDDPIVKERCFLSLETCNKNSPCPFHDSWNAERSRLIQFLKKNKIRKN